MDWTQEPIMFRGAPLKTVETDDQLFVAFVTLKYWMHMPKLCGVITGIAAVSYPRRIQLPEGV